MSGRIAAVRRSLVAAVTAILLTVGFAGAVFAPGTARADSAPIDPADPRTPTTVTADPLPTVQVNGVVWSQVVIGNTVYVGGEFTRARPAGARPGTSEVVRNNMLAYDIRTGELIPSFAPSLNAQAVVVAASPDGSRVYVGGNFTSVNGQARYRVAAFDTATGALVANFRPAVNAQVRALAATNTTVYVGGSFSAVGSSSRNRLAAFSVSTGALLPWAPQPGAGPTTGNRVPNNPTLNATPSRDVMSLVVAGSNGQVVAAGRFYTLNGVRATGVGALDGVTGATRPFEAGTIIRNHGITSAVYHLSTDGTNVYGVAYDYYGPGNLEGPFAVAANGGTTRWYADCRGDSYSSFPARDLLYTASHAHTCVNIGSFPDQSPKVYKHANAFSKAPAGVNTRVLDWNGGSLAGRPAPAHQAWAPSFDVGSYTGQFQAAWSVAGNDQFVVYGGEFPFVDDRAQQGLVRFAVPATAPNKMGPTGSGFAPTVTMQPGAARVSWRAVYDPDNQFLTYRVYRDTAGGTPACVVTRPSTWWNRPTHACSDTGATAGSHRYQVVASDAWGNTLASTWTTTTVGSSNSGPARMYADLVQADGALSHWPLGESSGTTAYDRTGAADMTAGTGVARGLAGAVSGDPDKAYSFNGTSSGSMYTRSAVTAPNTFSLEAWFQTTSTTGGKLIGFGNAQTGLSSRYDRHVYMDTTGHLYFGVYSGGDRFVRTDAAFNDGRWHHVVGTLSHRGLTLYADGAPIGTLSTVTSGDSFSGYWRVGGDNSWLANQDWFNGRLDEVAVYPTALSAAQVARHFSAGSSGNVAPTASFTAVPSDLAVAVDGAGSTDPDGRITGWAWDFGDGATGAGATATHTYDRAGTYPVRLTVTDEDGATGTVTRDVTVTAPPVGPGSVATDAFAREVASGWGAADRGGAWTISGGPTNARVSGGSGRLTGAPGQGMGAVLGEVSRQDVSVQSDVVLSSTPTGGGTYVSLGGRQVGGTDYRATVRFRPTGEVDLRLDRIVAGAETILISQQVLGSYVPGTPLTVRFEVSGTGSTAVRAKLWAAGAAEPAAWTVTSTDATAELQRPGALFVETYTSGTATGASTVLVDNVRAEPAGTVAEPQPDPNLAPVARFTDTPSGLSVAFDGTTSTDDDGRIVTYAWDFGDGRTGDGATASHTYAAGGTYLVVLKVTDDDGVSALVRRNVTVTSPVNSPPVASFTVVPVEGMPLTVTADSSASTDSDGRIVTTAFDFGDGGEKGTGVVSGHTYAGAGTYTVTLTVTDDDGATATATRQVTVTSAPDPEPEPPLAADAFERSVATGWGTADRGGAWTVTGGSAVASVSGGTASLGGGIGRGVNATLTNVSAQDVAVQTDVALVQAATGGGSYLSVGGRQVGFDDYRATLRFRSDGLVDLRLDKVVDGVETVLVVQRLAGTYSPGTALTVRLEIDGAALRAKAWRAGTAEPTEWTVTATDTTAALQRPGVPFLRLYTSGTATQGQVVRVDDVWVGAPGQTPQAP